MQQQGAWYASLAHVDAFRQRYGDRPALRLLQADALRETGQADAAIALYRELSSGPQAAAAAHGLGLIAARRDDDAGSEQALARATQLQPLNTDYLGDLAMHGCVPASSTRRASRWPRRWNCRQATPRPRPTSPCGRCCAATRHRGAPGGTGQPQRGHPPQHPAAGPQIRTRLQQRQAAAASTPLRARRQRCSARRRAARGWQPNHAATRDERDPQRLPSMLERFSTTDHPTGSTP
jgi:hypothetical protein